MKMNGAGMDQLVPLRVAAGEIDVHWKTLRNWSKAGRAPAAVRLGTKIYYRSDEFADWIANATRADHSELETTA
jgi:predicted site-specific integrase-resolvase